MAERTELKPLSDKPRKTSYDDCIEMGLSPAKAKEIVDTVLERLERERKGD